MGLKNLDIKRSYISYGDDNIPKAFLVPALRYAKSYQRSVGFFSSSVFLPIMDGIVSLFRNGGKIQLIASPQLSEEDIQAINLLRISSFRYFIVFDYFLTTFIYPHHHKI